MSLSLKLGSLFIRTAAKPIANLIKRNARDHARFRGICVSIAQSLHRIDIRLRLGLLQDPAAIDRQIAREAAEAESRRKAQTAPTVPTKEQADAEAKLSKEERHKIEEKLKAEEKERAKRRKIRPLSEAKAIDSGANFISESFLFVVAAALIGFETWRNRSKEAGRREDVKERLESLEGRLGEIEGERDQERERRIRFQEQESLMRQELKRRGIIWAEMPGIGKEEGRSKAMGQTLNVPGEREIKEKSTTEAKDVRMLSSKQVDSEDTGRGATPIESSTTTPNETNSTDNSKD